MNTIVTLVLFMSMDLFFLKDSPDLLVRLEPNNQSQQATVFYSYHNTAWDTVVVQRDNHSYHAILKAPDSLEVVGLYVVYDNGDFDNNNEALYLYEVRKSPKMLMPISLTQIELMIKSARKKILAGIHVSEAITLLDYVDHMLKIMPVVKDSESEIKREVLRVDVRSLRDQIE
jgi:hypothetical protein